MEGGPHIIQLSTPKKRKPCHAALVAEHESSSSTAATRRGADEFSSPCVPADWQPLEYELLEYADSLPRDFADRMGCELEAQDQRVAQLRSLNVLLADMCVACEEQRVPPDQSDDPDVTGQTLPPQPPQLQAAEFATSSNEVADAVVVTKEKVATLRPELSATGAVRDAESAQRMALTESARRLDAKARDAKNAAEQEMAKLTARLRAAGEQQRLLTQEAAQAASERKRLLEAEADLLRQRSRMQQLEVARGNAERRARQREEEVQQLQTDVRYLQEEVNDFRAQVPLFHELEQQEEDLKRRLRPAKAALRGAQRDGGAVPCMKENMLVNRNKGDAATAPMPHKGYHSPCPKAAPLSARLPVAPRAVQ